MRRIEKAKTIGWYSQQFNSSMLALYVSRLSVQVAQAPNTTTEPQMSITKSTMVMTPLDILLTPMPTFSPQSIFPSLSAHFLQILATYSQYAAPLGQGSAAAASPSATSPGRFW